MGQCVIMTGGYAGDSSDDCTALQSHVLEGYKAITKDSNDDAILGTMPNRGIGSHAVNSGINDKGLWYYIPPGYYPGGDSDGGNCWVYRSQAEVAATAGITSAKIAAGNTVLGVQGDGWTVWTGGVDADPGHVLSGKTYWRNGAKLTGNMASMGGQTITPSASQQTVATSGKYMTGNVVVNPFFQYYTYDYNITVRKPNCYISGQTDFNFYLPFTFDYTTQSFVVMVEIRYRSNSQAYHRMYQVFDSSINSATLALSVKDKTYDDTILGLKYYTSRKQIQATTLRLNGLIDHYGWTVPNENYFLRLIFNVFSCKLKLA